jgi:gamma-glutamyltranspeptidase/glutathione hydrolase
MASTSNPLSTQAAVTVLQNGGNAMDAAIAASAVQAVVEPESTGIGGDCFCLYSEAGSDKVIALNGSGRAPMSLTADWLLAQGIKEIPQQSPHAVTVPTAIDAWVQLNRDYGKKSLGDLLQPAIGYALKMVKIIEWAIGLLIKTSPKHWRLLQKMAVLGFMKAG